MKILVIRRDNIGDLICTTPLLSGLRQVYPQAWIGVLANAYNAPILTGNPDINAIFAYRKAKHRSVNESLLGVWTATAALLWQLRRMHFDMILCASPGARRFARLLGAQRIIEADRSGNGHETEITSRLLAELGLNIKPAALTLLPNASQLNQLRLGLKLEPNERCLAVHLSARKPRQRWPIERHAALIRRALSQGLATHILLFWAPGAADDPLHPGDDDKAMQLLAALDDLPVTPVPTHTLEALVAGLSLANMVICSDGGAMHVAAGLGKPIVCLFGNSSAERWHPWGVPYELLQKPSQDVADISVDEVHTAFLRLQERIGSR